MDKASWILGITGASGAIYAARFLHYMSILGYPVDVIMSDAGRTVLRHEHQEQCLSLARRIFEKEDWFAPPASGSSLYAGMVVAPCSMGTLARISAGISDSLLTRAADVMLKEKKSLVLVVREMPLSRIHLENMLRVSDGGGVILPASPHFYRHPHTVEEVADTVVIKILDQLRIEHRLVVPWGENA